LTEYGNAVAAAVVVGALIAGGMFYSADRKSVVAAGFQLPCHVVGNVVVVRLSEICLLIIHLCNYYSADGYVEAIHQKHRQYWRHHYSRHALLLFRSFFGLHLKQQVEIAVHSKSESTFVDYYCY
jgi:hypothetical protein